MMNRVLLLCFVLTIALPFAAHASNKLQPLPDVQSLDIQTFVSQSAEINKTFDEDPYLNFKVQIPKAFTEQNESVLKNYMKDGRLYGEVYRANGPIVEDVYPYFSVKTYPLERAISAKNWLISNVLKSSQTLRSIESKDKGSEFEALIVRFDELGNTEVVRSKGYLKGARIIVAEYVVPVMLWNEQRDYQTYAIKSFELTGVADNQSVENMLSYIYMESFSMKYPETWRMTAENKNDENRLDVSFITADALKVPFATIDVTLVADQSIKDLVDRSRYVTNLPQIIEARKKAVLDTDMVIGDVMERRTYDLSFTPDLQITEIYPLRKKLTDYVTHKQAPVSREFWITVIKGSAESGKNYVVSMVAPARGESIDNWAIAAKSYEMMVESLQ